MIERATHNGRRLGALALLLSLAVVAADARGDEGAARALAGDAARSYAAGRFGEAAEVWRDALGQFEHEQAPALASSLWMWISSAEISLGHYGRALRSGEQALGLAQRSGDLALELRVRAHLGGALLAAGEVARARETLDAAVGQAREAGLRDVAAAAGNNLGTALAARRELALAVQAFDGAAQDALEAADPMMAARALTNAGRTLRDSARFDASADRLEQASALLDGLDPSHDKAYVLVSIGRLYAGFPRRVVDARQRAETVLGAATESAAAVGDARALSYALGYRGEFAERAGRLEEALDLSRQAVDAAQRSGATESLYRWQWQTGRVLKALGDRDGALRAHARAVATLQGIRTDLSSGYMGTRASFRERVGPVYLQLADLLLESARDTDSSARREALLREARATVELLKGAELSDYFADDCVAEFRARSAGIEQLAPRTAAVYPIILDDRLDVLLSAGGEISLYSTPVPREELVEVTRALRRGLERRIVHGYLPASRQIYEWVVRPLEPDLARLGAETIVFVPDGALRTVPLASLHDGSGFLVERFAVATTPGLTLTDPQPIPREDVELLLSGLTESVQGFPPLPAVEEELETVSSLFPSTTLKDGTFLLPTIEAQLESTAYSIVHMASHGQFDAELSDTFLLTYDGRLDMDELGDLMGITTFRPRPVELLTLSACQTAAGDDRAALGLAGVAVRSGARSALATLWFVNDRSSSVLVSEFYRNLKNPELTKAQALQRAQVSLLTRDRYRHPAYWSAYLLIGNWL